MPLRPASARAWALLVYVSASGSTGMRVKRGAHASRNFVMSPCHSSGQAPTTAGFIDAGSWRLLLPMGPTGICLNSKHTYYLSAWFEQSQ